MPTQVFTFPSQVRQNDAQGNPQVFDIPQPCPPQFTRFVIATNVPLADLQNPANSVLIKLWVFDPSINDFRLCGGSLWVGSASPNSKGQWVAPGWGQVISPLAYSNPSRFTIDIPNPMTIGGSATLE